MAAAVEIADVGKRFRLPLEPVDSLKERVIRGRGARTLDLWALRGVTCTIDEGQAIGILGHNGSGKSTLLKCIAGILRPTEGAVRTRGRTAALLELGAGFHPDLSGRENVFLNGSILGLSRSEISRIFDEIVAFAELEEFIDNQVKHYSSGMYARLAFSVAVAVEPEILLLDEVLAVGDESFQRKCLERIKAFKQEGRTILLVTHAADMVRQICDRAIVLDRGELVMDGDPGRAVLEFRDSLLRRGIERSSGTGEAEHLDRAIRITDVGIEYSNARAYALADEPVRVTAIVDSQHAFDDVVASLNIYDRRGNVIAGTNTDLLDHALGVIDGPRRITFELGQVPLIDGVYEVHCSLHSRDGGLEYDRRAGRDYIEVLSPGRSTGLVNLRPRVETDEPAPASDEETSSALSDPAPDLTYSRACDVNDFSDPQLLRLVRQLHPRAVKRWGASWPAGREHRKLWEMAMAIRTLTDLGGVGPDADVLGVGAGRETTSFWLTRSVRRVFATDLYLEPGTWARTATSAMLGDVEGVAQRFEFDWLPNRLVVQHMDGRALRFEDDSFRGLFSSSSIEHFGTLDDVRQAASEMCRVLAPGGVASIATELRLGGPTVERPGLWLFDAATLRECVVDGLGWDLVEPFVTEPSSETSSAPVDLDAVVDGRIEQPNSVQHVAVTQDGLVWTSVHLALRKRGGR